MLNSVLHEPGLYDERAVHAVALRDETREFAHVHFRRGWLYLAGDDLLRFNRLLLAYSGDAEQRDRAIVNVPIGGS